MILCRKMWFRKGRPVKCSLLRGHAGACTTLTGRTR